jgi:hypothetical protein
MKVFTDLLISAFPMLILLGFWWYFMRRYRGTQAKQTDYMADVKVCLTEHLAETRRLNENLDRIANALEKKN